MPKKRKRKETVVPPSAFRYREEDLLKDTTGIEALEVFKSFQKLGRLLSSFIIVVGALLSLFSWYCILTSKTFSFSDPISIGALSFLGILTIIFGLVLLTK